ncbi:MAG: 2-C-methyl-D-erythritol 4-phosphate cytidylyltransferase [Paludibacteraceae bacterium]|nr:2-C-methyl-D-erythritol 4-phosphate cytidylyltransferase [Paludibacteraceae bacterium]
MKHIAVILAGGTGSRVGGNTPKQLLPLEDGRSILEHSVDAFEAAECIDEIAIVMHSDWIAEAQRLCLQNSWQKVQHIIPGGNERWESSWKAIEEIRCQKSDVSLWFHDAARPFVSQRILTDVAAALKEHEAVTVAVPVTDTLYRVAENKVESIPSRAEYMRAQTPQAFHLNVIAEAFERALKSGDIIATDDAGIVNKYMPEVPIYIVPGEETNKKITYKEDLKRE